MSDGRGELQALIEDLVENCDRPEEVYEREKFTSAETYIGKRMPMIGAKVRASTKDKVARLSVLEARANGPAAEAGAHASILGLGAYVQAELVRAEASAAGFRVAVGPNLNTGVQVGIDGASVRALGFGASVGPYGVGLHTPLGEVKCSIM